MIDVLLAHSYFLRFDPKLYAAMQPYPPLGTLYAAAYLRAHGHGRASPSKRGVPSSLRTRTQVSRLFPVGPQ